MGQITSTVGLTTGFPIQDTVKQLIQVAARPRDLLVSRTQTIQNERAGVNTLLASVLGVQIVANRLKNLSLFQSTTATSSNANTLKATVTGTPAVGSYAFTPIRQAQSHQLLSSGVSTLDQALGAGQLSVRFGGFIDPGVSLSSLNGGQGVQRGKIRITDQSNTSAVVDLRFAQTIDDVLDAINNATGIRVKATAQGDAIKLVDQTGQNVTNLLVQEVGGGSTAADLGLANINTNTGQATGKDIFRLSAQTSLSSLNGGNGISFSDSLPDLEINFRNGSPTLSVDFLRTTTVPGIAKATTNAAGGTESQVKFTATRVGGELDGFQVQFVDDVNVTVGNETLDYDPTGKKLTFHIDAGHTTADEIVSALNAHPQASLDFTAGKTVPNHFASADTTAAARPEAQLHFRALKKGQAYDGVTISFVNDPGVTRGNETVDYDLGNKTLVFHIAEGQTTADDIVHALANHAQASADFAVERVGSTSSSATTSGAAGPTSQLRFQALQPGASLDGYAISFIDDANVTAGNETLDFDSQAKTLVFHIEQGATTSNDIIAALANHPQASQKFQAVRTAADNAATATTFAANGQWAELHFQSLHPGAAGDGLQVSFVDDVNVTAGNETVEYDPQAKTVVFHIQAGVTTAEQVAAAAVNDALFSADYVVSTNDFYATASTTSVGGIDAQLDFTAITPGSDLDGVAISFVDDANVVAGQETVEFDQQAKTLVFHIAAGSTTANDIVAALAQSDAASYYSASVANGGTGLGLIDVSDSAFTAGGTADGLIDVSDAAVTSGGAPDPIDVGDTALTAGGAGGLISSTDTAVTSGGTAGLIDVTDSAITAGGVGQQARKETTLEELLRTLNEADPSRLKAEISADGDRIVLTDLTLGSGTFSVVSAFGGSTAEDLGLTGSAAGGVITGGRLQAGMKTSLLSNLNGGKGLGTLGTLSLTDHSGATATVNLSGAETLDDVLAAINGAGLGIKAQYNTSRTGILISDTTGLNSGRLIVANGDATNTAQKLGIEINSSQASVNSGSLRLQVVSEYTKLNSLYGGLGVNRGSFLIVDSSGDAKSINLSTIGTDTVGDVINLINNSLIGVKARINDDGDGIAIIDTAHGSATLHVSAIGTSTAANDLRILGTAKTVDINGVPTQVIDGSTTLKVVIDASDTMATLVNKLNDLKGGLSASVFNDGSGATPYRLALSSQVNGKAGELRLDTSQTSLRFETVVKAQDALLLVGESGVVATSNNNRFDNVLSGISLTVTGSSLDTVVVNVAATDTSLVSTVGQLVDQYNSLRGTLSKLTYFDSSNNTSGVLFSSTAALRVDSDLSRLLSGRFFGIGNIHSLQEVGINFNNDGTISFDQTKLQDKFAADPEAVTKFFTTENSGFASKLSSLIDTLAGTNHSLLVDRVAALQSKIDLNSQRVTRMNERLDAQQQLLLKQFYNMDLAIGKLQSNLTYISQIQAVPPLYQSS